MTSLIMNFVSVLGVEPGILVFLWFLLYLHFFMLIWTSILRYLFEPEVSPLALMVFLGLLGWLIFWGYYWRPLVGECSALAVFALTICAFVFQLKTKNGRSLLVFGHKQIFPVTMYIFFVMSLGFFPFNNIGPSAVGSRFIGATDNIIPKFFADMLRHPFAFKTPMIGDWLSSDRPPLQTGIYLLFFRTDKVFYQILCSFMQGMVLLPFCVLIRTLYAGKFAFVAIIALGLTVLLGLHTLFVWPKLLATSYLLIFYILTMTPLRKAVNYPLWIFLTGSSAALAMLSHGASIFFYTRGRSVCSTSSY